MSSDEDTFSFSVILRSTSAAQHLKNIKRAQLNPTTFLWAVHLLRKKIQHKCHIQVYQHGPTSEEHQEGPAQPNDICLG